MSVKDKELIEERFGPLWSGPESVSIGDRIFTMQEIKRAFDIAAIDVVGIDLHSLPDGRYAFRFYDGDDRRIVVFVFDGELDILEEHRAHIAEWLEEDYYKAGMLAFVPDELVRMLRAKIVPGESGPPTR